MRRTFILLCSFLSFTAYSQIDMQAHVASDEGKAAYNTYISKQQGYYSGNYAYQYLAEQEGSTLFGTLNELMGSTCKTNQSGFDYGALRYEYVSVDRDLNKSGNFIAFYSGSSASATWDSGKTWNREHVWPQSNGVSSSKPMGYDMNSVRPTLTKDNSSRQNTAYGEGSGYYNPDELKISNPNYKAINNGTYKGDCARIILYDYLVYGEMGGKKNVLYNDAAQLLDKLGTSSQSVFESVEILLKWHMQDPPSLTEIVRNDGGEEYQGNRNPFIDYPELAIQILQDEVKTYTVSTNIQMQPAYRMTTADGFVAYLNKSDGSHPQTIEVTGATYNYNAQLGRITLSRISNDVTITTSEEVTALENAGESIHYHITGNRLCVDNLNNADVAIYTLSGAVVSSASAVNGEYNVVLSAGAYILRAGAIAKKILIVE
ncbi:MAG: endonuclease [Paludibacteraceae bacterium]|nr:endonuclease [Paludibacteraceae bacterium]